MSDEASLVVDLKLEDGKEEVLGAPIATSAYAFVKDAKTPILYWDSNMQQCALVLSFRRTFSFEATKKLTTS